MGWTKKIFCRLWRKLYQRIYGSRRFCFTTCTNWLAPSLNSFFRLTTSDGFYRVTSKRNRYKRHRKADRFQWYFIWTAYIILSLLWIILRCFIIFNTAVSESYVYHSYTGKLVRGWFSNQALQSKKVLKKLHAFDLSIFSQHQCGHNHHT